MKALCPYCIEKGLPKQCEKCNSTGYIEVNFPQGRKYKRYDKVCNVCNKVVGGCFSGTGLPEPKISEHAICPYCDTNDLRLVLADEER